MVWDLANLKNTIIHDYVQARRKKSSDKIKKMESIGSYNEYEQRHRKIVSGEPILPMVKKDSAISPMPYDESGVKIIIREAAGSAGLTDFDADKAAANLTQRITGVFFLDHCGFYDALIDSLLEDGAREVANNIKKGAYGVDLDGKRVSRWR